MPPELVCLSTVMGEGGAGLSDVEYGQKLAELVVGAVLFRDEQRRFRQSLFPG